MEARWTYLLLFFLLALATTCRSLTITNFNKWNDTNLGPALSADPCIVFSETVTSWTLSIQFDSPMSRLDIWDGDATKVSETSYEVTNKAHNGQKNAGDELCFSFNAYAVDTHPTTITISILGQAESPTTTTTTTSTTTTTTTSGSPAAGDKDYIFALHESILFYEAERSGDLDEATKRISWRRDSALGDCVKGGWYDAGDYVKFGLPMASSATLLLWSLHTFKDGYAAAGELDYAYDQVKWPLDYFVKAWDEVAQSLVVQVGDGDIDHSYWIRAEDMAMERPCQYVTSSNKGSDIAAETAAALAVGSIVFAEKGDADYAATLLAEAQSLYAFASSPNHRGVFTGAEKFYKSSGDADELCVAAMWLYKATQQISYLSDAQVFKSTYQPWSLSWDNKFLACDILMYNETGDSSFKIAIEDFFNTWQSLNLTSCGLAYRDSWGVLRYAANAAFAALQAAEMGVNTEQLRKWGAEQINYMLGDNEYSQQIGKCFSYMVGYGDDYPLKPHHAGASCPLDESCGFSYLSLDMPNPHVLHGALVGGPKSNGDYVDDREDYIHNEVTNDYNAGFQGALAGLVHLKAAGSFPQTSNICPCS